MDAFRDRVIQRVAEAKLRVAMKQGDFDNPPGFGKPFEFDELTYDPHWWIRHKLNREQLVQRLRALETRKSVAGQSEQEA